MKKEKQVAKIEKGTALSFCGGEWSDKWTTGPFEVLKDIDQEVVVAGYKATYAGKVDEWGDEACGDESGFIAYLTKQGYIRDVEQAYSWYVGAGYGYDFDPVIA